MSPSESGRCRAIPAIPLTWRHWRPTRRREWLRPESLAFSCSWPGSDFLPGCAGFMAGFVGPFQQSSRSLAGLERIEHRHHPWFQICYTRSQPFSCGDRFLAGLLASVASPILSVCAGHRSASRRCIACQYARYWPCDAPCAPMAVRSLRHLTDDATLVVNHYRHFGRPFDNWSIQFSAMALQLIHPQAGQALDNEDRLNDRSYLRLASNIHQLVRQGEFLPGQRLPSERALADRFGVSRTAVREAIIALELQGVVEVRGGSGIYVCQTQDGSARL